jgi:hypothetical protein
LQVPAGKRGTNGLPMLIGIGRMEWREVRERLTDNAHYLALALGGVEPFLGFDFKGVDEKCLVLVIVVRQIEEAG